MAFSASSLKVSPTITRLIAAMLGIVLLAWGGLRASRAGAARRSELRQAQATLTTFANLRRRYEPAVAAESIAWRRTWMQLQGLGVAGGGDERLALTHAITEAAEAAGLRDVRVTGLPPDTTGSDARLSTQGARRQSAPFGLLVECRGNLQAVVTFLGELPASVAPTSLSLVQQDGARHRLTLAVYELQFSNGQSPFESPLERGNPRRVGVGRIGG